MLPPHHHSPNATAQNGAPRLVRFDEVTPDRGQIARLVGLQPGRERHQRWFDLLDKLLAELPRLMRPRAVFRVDDVVELKPGHIALSNGVVFHGAVGAFLKHSVKIATFIVTVGSGLERLSHRWMRAGKVMPATIVDAIASESAEACAERVQTEVQTYAHAVGLAITPRYSPGYCGMTVREQVPLFRSLPAAEINVRLKPSCLMIPIKSVSGLIGLGPRELVGPGGYPCERCDLDDCMQRRAAFVGLPPGSCQAQGAIGDTCLSSQ